MAEQTELGDAAALVNEVRQSIQRHAALIEDTTSAREVVTELRRLSRVTGAYAGVIEAALDKLAKGGA